MENVTIKVEGMSCNHCVNAIEGSVGRLTGVKAVQVDLQGGSVAVSYDSEKVELSEIKETIEDQGYDVV
ncbi:copper chaperone CopZ [Radiobacillus kanasensis]|uniref:copper chaperone CopZ n=1 Tax=Radiobacillus kanasensis TaxID=2844358 RepID=UPI001E40FF59|nr:copper chaperone CopZ [Radiobacillus kanasensis]UFU00694.1 copper chaperone CopZ [Radiobacillus kanasensis]